MQMASTGTQNTLANKTRLSPDVLQHKSLGHLLKNKLTGENASELLFIDASTGIECTGCEVYKRMQNVACYLLDFCHLEPGSPVGIILENSINHVILSFGVILAGGIAVSPNEDLSDGEITHFAQQVRPRILFGKSQFVSIWAENLKSDLGYPIRAIAVNEELMNYDSSRSTSRPCIPIACKDLTRDIAFISVYKVDDKESPTAETIMRILPVTHKACLTEQSLFESRERAHETRVAIQSPLDKVLGRWLVLRAAIEGYTGVIFNGFKVIEFARAIEKYRINAIFLGVNELNTFINHINQDRISIPSLRIISPAGCRVVYGSSFSEFLNENPQIREIYLGYGSSEISMLTIRRSSVKEYLDDDLSCGLIPAHTEMKLVSASTGQLCTKPNEEGMIHIRGPTVFPGYYDKRNARDGNDHFVCRLPDPDEPTFDNEGFYITRDHGYLNENHELCIEASWRWFSWDVWHDVTSDDESIGSLMSQMYCSNASRDFEAITVFRNR